MAVGPAGLGDMEMAYVQARAGAFTDAEALRGVVCLVARSMTGRRSGGSI